MGIHVWTLWVNVWVNCRDQLFVQSFSYQEMQIDQNAIKSFALRNMCPQVYLHLNWLGYRWRPPNLSE